MEPKDIFEENRGERSVYEVTTDEAEVLLPLTRDGFEALLERAAKVYSLPIDDSARSILAGYIHHVDRQSNTLSLSSLAKALYKSVANATSWRIDQEAKMRRQEQQKLMAESASTQVSDEDEKPLPN